MHNGSKVHPPQISHIPAPTTQQQNQQRFNWGSILKPAAGGLFGIASSVFNHFMSERSAEKQYQRQLDFWEKQNEYNSPSAQRKRLEAAGFNPALALGDIAGNNAAGQLSSVPGNDYDKRGFLDLGALNNSLQLFTQMESIGANTDMMKRQIELSYIEELIKNSTKYGIDLTNQEREELLKWLPKEKEANLKTALEQINKIIAERDQTKASTTGINIDNNNKQRQYDDAHRAADDDHNIKLAAEKRSQTLFDMNKEYVKSVNDLGLKLNQVELSRFKVSDLCKDLTGVSLASLPPEIQDYLSPLVTSLDNLVQTYNYFAEGSHRYKYNSIDEYLRAKKELSDSIEASKKDIVEVVTNYANDSYANHSTEYFKILDAKLLAQQNIIDKILSLFKK